MTEQKKRYTILGIFVAMFLFGAFFLRETGVYFDEKGRMSASNKFYDDECKALENGETKQEAQKGVFTLEFDDTTKEEDPLMKIINGGDDDGSNEEQGLRIL